MKLKQYPKYKESGLPWMGNIPAHWGIRRLRTIAHVRPSGVDKKTNESEMPVKLCNYVDVYKNERITESIDFMKATATPDEIAKFELKSGDVLITKDSEMWNDIAVPAFVPQEIPGVICAYHLAIVRPISIEGEFLFRAFLAESIADQFRVSANGVTRYGLSQGAIKDAWFPIPPKEEQKAIAAFIRSKEKKIAKSIRNKRRLIQLLKEQKRAIINQAVMRGIDPDVKMRPSGVDWLGEIPQEWKVKRFKNACRLQRGYDLSNDKFVEGTIPVYGSNGVIGYHNAFTTNAPCITVGRSGSVGEVNFVDHDFWAHNTTLFVIENYQNDWKYLYYLLQNIDLKMVSGGSAVPTLNRNYIHQMYVAIPSYAEQQRIVLYIESRIQKINVIIARTEREIELIQEYRTRLISDVVTGKMDVRNIKVEDVAEEELLEDVSDTEETPAYAEASAGREELEDSIEDGKEV